MKESKRSMKDKLVQFVSKRRKESFVALGAFAAFALVFIGLGVESVSAFKVCSGGNMSGQMQETIKNFMTFLIAIAFGGGTLYAAFNHVKDIFDVGDGEPIWESEALYAAVGLPFGLFVIDFALSTVFNVDVSCLMPW